MVNTACLRADGSSVELASNQQKYPICSSQLISIDELLVQSCSIKCISSITVISRKHIALCQFQLRSLPIVHNQARPLVWTQLSSAPDTHSYCQHCTAGLDVLLLTLLILWFLTNFTSCFWLLLKFTHNCSCSKSGEMQTLCLCFIMPLIIT